MGDPDEDDGEVHHFKYEKVDEKKITEGREYLSLIDVFTDYKESPFYSGLSHKEKRMHNKKYMVKQIKTNPILKRYHKEEYIIGKNAEGGNIKKKGVLRCFKRVELSTFAIDTGDDL